MDASIITLISLCVTSATAIGLAWIAYKQAHLSKAVEEVRHNTNSLTSQLVAQTEITSKAEGNAAGRAEQKAEAAGAPPQPS
jgi:hypothetical protein